jgi:hypothetical protein
MALCGRNNGGPKTYEAIGIYKIYSK